MLFVRSSLIFSRSPGPSGREFRWKLVLQRQAIRPLFFARAADKTWRESVSRIRGVLIARLAKRPTPNRDKSALSEAFQTVPSNFVVDIAHFLIQHQTAYGGNGSTEKIHPHALCPVVVAFKQVVYWMKFAGHFLMAQVYTKHQNQNTEGLKSFFRHQTL